MAGPPGSPRNSIAPKPSIVTSRPVRPSARLANSGMTHLRWSNAFKSSAASKRLGAPSAQGGSGKRTGITDIVLIRGASVHQSLYGHPAIDDAPQSRWRHQFRPRLYRVHRAARPNGRVRAPTL